MKQIRINFKQKTKKFAWNNRLQPSDLIATIQKVFQINDDFYLVSESQNQIDLNKIREEDIESSVYQLEMESREIQKQKCRSSRTHSLNQSKLAIINDIEEFKLKYLSESDSVSLIIRLELQLNPKVDKIIQKFQHKVDCFYVHSNEVQDIQIFSRNKKLMEISIMLEQEKIEKYLDKILNEEGGKYSKSIDIQFIIQLLNEEYLNMRIEEQHFYYIKCQVLENNRQIIQQLLDSIQYQYFKQMLQKIISNKELEYNQFNIKEQQQQFVEQKSQQYQSHEENINRPQTALPNSRKQYHQVQIVDYIHNSQYQQIIKQALEEQNKVVTSIQELYQNHRDSEELTENIEIFVNMHNRQQLFNQLELFDLSFINKNIFKYLILNKEIELKQYSLIDIMRLSSGYLDKQLLSHLNKQQYDKLVRVIGNVRSQLNRQITSLFKDIDYNKPIYHLIIKIQHILIQSISNKKSSQKSGNKHNKSKLSTNPDNSDNKVTVQSHSQQSYKNKIQSKQQQSSEFKLNVKRGSQFVNEDDIQCLQDNELQTDSQNCSYDQHIFNDELKKYYIMDQNHIKREKQFIQAMKDINVDQNQEQKLKALYQQHDQQLLEQLCSYQKTQDKKRLRINLDKISKRQLNDINNFQELFSPIVKKKIGKINNFQAIMNNLIRKKVIQQRQKKVFMHLFMEEDICLISAYEVYNMTDDQDDFIESLMTIDKVNFFKMSVKQKELLNEAQSDNIDMVTQQHFLYAIKQHLSTEQKKCLEILIKAGDVTLLQIMKKFNIYKNKGEFISQVQNYSDQKINQVKFANLKMKEQQNNKVNQKIDQLESFFYNKLIKGVNDINILKQLIESDNPTIQGVFEIYNYNKDKYDFIENITILDNYHQNLDRLNKYLVHNDLDYDVKELIRDPKIKAILQLHQCTNDHKDFQENISVYLQCIDNNHK